MKLAVIDYKFSYNDIKERLKTRGIVVDIAETLKDFEDKYGSLENYEGLLLHPDIKNWSSYLRDIPKKYPELKYAIATHGLGDYFDDGKVSVLDFSDLEGIIEYFSK